MRNSKLYSVQDIEMLKQKIAVYRDNLATLKMGDSTDDYLALKNELNGFKVKMLGIEGVMNSMDEKQNRQIAEHEQQATSFSDQIEGLNETVEALNQGISLLVNRLSNEANDQLSSSNFLNNEESGMKSIKETTVPFKEQYASKRNFPSNGRNPSQTYYGPSTNLNMKSIRTINNFVKKQTIPIKINGSSAPSFILTDTNPKATDIVPEPIEVVQEVASVAEVTPIEKITSAAQVHPIAEEIHSIQLPIEESQQEIVEKATSPFFKFFRKKN